MLQENFFAFGVETTHKNWILDHVVRRNSERMRKKNGSIKMWKTVNRKKIYVGKSFKKWASDIINVAVNSRRVFQEIEINGRKRKEDGWLYLL